MNHWRKVKLKIFPNQDDFLYSITLNNYNIYVNKWFVSNTYRYSNIFSCNYMDYIFHRINYI